MLILPHGGSLVERLARNVEADKLKHELERARAIELDDVALADLEMLAIGGYSPLDGFMGSKDAQRVAHEMRLTDGTLWPIPITLGLPESLKDVIKPGERVGLRYGGELVGLLEVSEIFERDVDDECQQVFLTSDAAHPGVAQVLKRGPWCVAGRVTAFSSKTPEAFSEHRLTPVQSRSEFDKRGWKKIVGFQTRNPIHRAHEYIVKSALEICDGLFLHPLVGFTKSDDIPADVRMTCYQTLIESSFPKDRVCLGVLPAPMRYAGPREAVMHAIVRKNYGCSHFIVGRDHAGVGSYYGTYDAQRIFDTFTRADIGIEPLCFEHSFFCKQCGQMGTAKTCPHDKAEHIFLSGTKVREMLQQGQRPPAEFTRPAVADVLIRWAKSS